jgi:hypothetical protein
MTFLSAIQRIGMAFGVAASLRAAPACAGELHKASAAVHGSHSSAPSSSSSSSSSGASSSSSSSSDGSGSSSSSSDDSGDSSLAGQVAAALFVDVLLSPFSLPRAALEAGPAPPGGWSLLSRPYENGARGDLVHVAPNDSDATSPDDEVPLPDLHAIAPDVRRDVAFQLAAEGMIPAQEVGRVQARARLMTVTRFDLDTAYARYFEQLPGGGATSAWSGQTHLTYRFAQSEKAQFRAGVGLRHWADDRGSAFGVDFIYGIDIFWGRPITTSLEATGGWVGDAWAFGARGTIGVVMGNGEVFAGYDATWMGDATGMGATAYLGGPVVGVRAYF